MKNPALDRVLPALPGGYSGPSPNGNYTARCPAHDDTNPSLSIRDGDTVDVVLRCHAGCDYADILDALGIDDLTGARTYTYVDRDGVPVYRKIRKRGKAMLWERPDAITREGLAWTAGLADTDRVLYNLPAVRAERGTVYYVEGEKDAERLREHGKRVEVCKSKSDNPEGPHATCQRFVTEHTTYTVTATTAGGAQDWHDSFADDLRHAERVVIIADNDRAGLDHARKAYDSLTARGIAAEVVKAAVLRDGADVSDHLNAGFELADLLPASLPVAKVELDLTRNRELDVQTDRTSETLLAANTPPVLYSQAGRFVREASGAELETVTNDALRYRAAQVVDFQGSKGPVYPPDAVVRSISGEKAHLFPEVERVVTAPILTADGRVIDTPGYHADAKVLYRPDEKLALRDMDVAEARAVLDDLLHDFPFDSDASRAGTYALMLTPVVRAMVDGPTPNMQVEAPVQGSGKSLLAEVCLLPSFGRAAGTSLPTGADETRKKLTAMFLRGAGYVWFDNVRGKFGNTALEQAVTATEWSDRILGLSKDGTMPVRAVWVSTVNNASATADMRRRTYVIRIEPDMENPTLRKRSEFRHPYLKVWAHEHRAELLSAVVALARAWVDAGSPAFKGEPMGSFEEWSRVVGGILQHAGVPGFLEHDDDYFLDDTSRDERLEFFASWNLDVKVGSEQWVLPADLLGKFGVRFPPEVYDDRGEMVDKTALNYYLRDNRGMVAGGFKLERSPKRTAKGYRWRVRVLENRRAEAAQARAELERAEFAALVGDAA